MAPETALSLRDILPINPKHYDKNRAPKLAGQPTIVYFHVTVLSLDSINEESMVSVSFGSHSGLIRVLSTSFFTRCMSRGKNELVQY